MKIIVDADACPVKAEILAVGKERNIPITFIMSMCHVSHGDTGAEVIVVDSLPQAVDMMIVNIVKQGEIVVTQDYGLAALVLGKKAKALSPHGKIFTTRNIDYLLEQRHFSAKIRRAGGKTKGARAFTEEDRVKFITSLIQLLEKKQE